MKTLIQKIRRAGGNESGAVMPVLMMMSSIMIISGVAFLSVSSYQAKTVTDAATLTQARYNAESGIRKALFRFNSSPVDQWASWASFNDTSYAVSFDAQTKTITSIGLYGGVSDTIKATVSIDTLNTQAQLGHIILYKKTLSVGPSVILTYSSGNGPIRMKGWWRKWRTKHDLLENLNDSKYRKHFLKKVKKKDKDKYEDLLHTYNGNQTFDGELEEGVHYVKGNVELRNGTTLIGSLYATGTITMSGTVTINAMQLPDESPLYPGYFPALVALRGSAQEQEEEDDATDMDSKTDVSNNITINGLIFSRRSVKFGSGVNVTGLIIARKVYLDGSCRVTFDGKYRLPPPPEMEIDEEYNPRVITWVE